MASIKKRILRAVSIILLLSLTILASIGYFYYRDLKRTFIEKISVMSSSYIGQRVEIGDLSFGPTMGINLHNIIIHNPAGFESGRLLRINRLYLKMRFRELFKQRFSFRDITVYSPELTLSKNSSGRWNISDRLIQLFSKESTVKYEVDEFNIGSGVFDLNGDENYRNDEIFLSLKNISPDPSVRTSVKGRTRYAAESLIYVEGWIYPKDPRKKLHISVSSKDLAIPEIRGFISRHRISLEKARIALRLDAEGDTEKGFHLCSGIGIRSEGFHAFKKDVKDILLDMRAFLNLRDKALLVDRLSLRAGDTTSVTLRAQIRDIFTKPFYAADIKIEKLDLSAFNMLKDLKVKGVMTSDNMRVRGHFREFLPEISGGIRLRDAALTSRDEDIKNINASVRFESKREVTIKGEATAKISKAYGHLLDGPADAALSLTAHGIPRSMTFTSSISLSPVGTYLKGGRRVSLSSIVFSIEGNMKNKVFSGKGRIETKDLTFTDYRFSRLRGLSSFGYRGNVLTAINPVIEGEDFKTSADRIIIRLPEKEKKEKRIVLQIEGVTASLPQTKAGLKSADAFLHLKGGESLSGNFGFRLNSIVFGSLRAAAIAGSGVFDNKNFSLDVPNAEVSGGKMHLAASGRTTGGPFPVKIRVSAEDIDIGGISTAASKISGTPYEMNGNLKSAFFEGTLSSAASVQGTAAIKAEKISLRGKESKRNLLKDVFFEGTAEFKGKDAAFKADAVSGKVSINFSGTTQDFLMKERVVSVRVGLPGVKAADIRDSFWDLFPDRLLYAGMDGSLASDFAIFYSGKDLKIDGEVEFLDLVLRGENGEYSIGRIKGILPIGYAKTDGRETIEMPAFDRSEFGNLTRYYAQKTSGVGYNRITIGSLSYGFKFIEGVEILVKQKGSVLNIGRISGSIFGGRLNGSAVLDFSKGLNYRVGVIVDGVSLTRLCDEIEPIKGYISGKVNGAMILKGSGFGISHLIGKADFWTYSTKDEKTKISKEFLERVGGASMKAYLGDRRFDKGEMSLYLQDGFAIFKNLEISHKNIFGMTDLSIKVAPFNNRIAVDQLMWSITEAAQRAKKE